MKWGVKIPLRDGVQLHANLYLPETSGASAPTIFTLTPYVAQRYHEQGLYFASHGYAFLCVDVRGRGNSEGEFRPLIQEAHDGYDVVEWLARQPFCNGKVAMWGASYMGYLQWATAKEFPPHLCAIVPGASPYVGLDFPMRGNIFSTYVMQWLTLVSGRTQQDQIFSNAAFWREQYLRWFESGTSFDTLDDLLGNPSPVFREWVRHPHQDDYWDRYNPTAEQYSRISLPILSITGIYDADQPGALMHYRQHVTHCSQEARDRHYLVIGPWDHVGTRAPQAEFCGMSLGPASVLDTARLNLDWYTWWLRGGEKPAFLRKNVAYYVLGAEEWRYADSLDGVTAQHRRLHLDSGGSASEIFRAGSLGPEYGTGQPDRFVHDPTYRGLAEAEAALTDPLALRPTFPTDNVRDQTHVLANDGRQLVYHSAPFEHETDVAGFFRLSAWIAIDQPDIDLRATVYEIGMDGSSWMLTSDCLRARYRESLRAAKPVVTDVPLRYDFERFTFGARRVAKGSRLRLVVSALHSIYYERNCNSGATVAASSLCDARSVNVSLFHDAAHPSALDVPLAAVDSSQA